MLTWGRKDGQIRPVQRGGDVVARLRPLAYRDHAGVEVDGTRWSYYARRDELFGERAGDNGATLRASRVTRRTYAVLADRTDYRIERFGLPRSRFTVARSGVEIGTSATVGVWTRRPTLDVDPATPLDHQVFLLWVAFVMRGRPGIRGRKRAYAGGTVGPGTGTAAFGGFGFDASDGGGLG